jgi:hypothetical protein
MMDALGATPPDDPRTDETPDDQVLVVRHIALPDADRAAERIRSRFRRAEVHFVPGDDEGRVSLIASAPDVSPEELREAAVSQA